MKIKNNKSFNIFFHIILNVIILLSLVLLYLYFSNLNNNTCKNYSEHFIFNEDKELSKCKIDKKNIQDKYEKEKKKYEDDIFKLNKKHNQNMMEVHKNNKNNLTMSNNDCINNINTINNSIQDQIKSTKDAQDKIIEYKNNMEQKILENDKECNVKIINKETEMQNKLNTCATELAQAKASHMSCQSISDYNKSTTTDQSKIYNTCLQEKQNAINKINELESKIKDLENEIKYIQYTSSVQQSIHQIPNIPDASYDISNKNKNNFTFIPNDYSDIEKIFNNINKEQVKIYELSQNLTPDTFKYTF